ncbi:hypothetical protein K490DRAFT_35371 [Saccharata proteae CBS 121410]|uniref:Protein CMS1 n=1 Tax=Saccharata proteae CBS 121410 TaxID=1314787 RepID=A0A9P4HZE4_9PEZI|nr:hypothetical protein K490DRAFT_35371 [Saccharata proteae CBS 121410]
MSDSEDQSGVPLIESLSRSASPEVGGKRKRSDDAKPESKRAAKKRKSKKSSHVDDGDLDEEKGVNTSIARMDSQLLADQIAQKTKKFQSDLSSVELEDRYLSGKAILDTSDWDQQRDLEHLPAFLEKFAGGDLKSAPKSKGCPHTIVIAASGIRAADLTRSLRKFETKDTKVGKLFAKHIKIKEAIEFCKKTRMNIGVGTPQRLSALLEDAGALSANGIQRLVVDASHIDQKKRGIMDMKDTHIPLVDLLIRDHFKARYGETEKKLQLLFY